MVTMVNDDIKAGREMDARIAAEVMGYVWDESRCRICGWPLVAQGESGCWSSNCSLRPPPEVRADEPAGYSTSIAAAWTVVDRLVSEGWGLMVHDNKPNDGYLVEFDTPERWAYADASTIAEAICRAALQTVEGDSDSETNIKSK